MEGLLLMEHWLHATLDTCVMRRPKEVVRNMDPGWSQSDWVQSGICFSMCGLGDIVHFLCPPSSRL